MVYVVTEQDKLGNRTIVGEVEWKNNQFETDIEDEEIVELINAVNAGDGWDTIGVSEESPVVSDSVAERREELTEEKAFEMGQSLFAVSNYGFGRREFVEPRKYSRVPATDRENFMYEQYAYDAPIDARHTANQIGLDGEYHVRKLNGETVYVPGTELDELETALGEEPKTNLESSKFAEYDAGTKVSVDGEQGVILELHTAEFSLGGETFEATQDDVLYVVGTAEGTLVVDEGEINTEAWDTEEGDPEKVTDAELKENYTKENTNPFDEYDPEVVRGNAIQGRIEAEDAGIGFDSWPDSWEESDKPARLIALDAWSSMQASFSGCMDEIGDRRICAAFKDSIYQTTQWR